MIDVVPILTEIGKLTVKQIQTNLSSTGTTATSKSAKSLQYEVYTDGDKTILKVTAKPYFMVVETGRKPTPDKKPSREMIENLGEWLKARGKEEKYAWAIAVKINKEGTALYKKGGRKDIVSNVVEQAFTEAKSIIMEEFKKAFIERTVLIFKRRAA